MDEQVKSKDKICTFSPLVQNVFFFIHTLCFSKTGLVPGVVLVTLTSTLSLRLRYVQVKTLLLQRVHATRDVMVTLHESTR